ncbi:hypothetical protein Pan44_35810 [Caulifigura coniformis]|uniref:Uncharacterized protein n=1 Tax=Caulifigura coniformis TaxID=2527983 RepID=A0A517SHG7_9PLAN|nr:hypothetical protein [Caulifigura coniformis]QDT55537.1 hypothetical protein Pan44_35810 [Caulifigura coniformis]
MSNDYFRHSERWRRLWDAVSIVRPVHYSLFTFGESELLYWLVQDSDREKTPVRIARGEVRVTRPLIITPDNAQPEFQNFFEDDETAGMAEFLLARSAAFSHLRFNKKQGPQQIVSDSVEEAVARLNRQLDSEDEDRVAILTAPSGLGSLAVLRYAAERIARSASDNIQELKERGFLPD